MPTFSPVDLQEWSQGLWKNGQPVSVTGFCIDTRILKPGQMFIAIKTEQRDGHDYMEQAIARGASCALVSQYRPDVRIPQLHVQDSVKALQRMAARHRRRFKGIIIAVTGSCGKTSTKELLAQLLGGEGIVHRTHANLNNHLGVPLSILEIDLDKHQFSVIEAGMSSRGELAEIARLIEPDIGIVTHVGPAHLEGVGGIEDVAEEKAQILKRVRPGGFCVFPEECLRFECFRSLHVPATVIARTEQPAVFGGCTIAPEVKGFWQREDRRFVYESRNIGQLSDDRTVVSIKYLGTSFANYTVPRFSSGMMSNAVISLIVASALGVSEVYLQLRLLRWSPPSFRGEIATFGAQSYYVDCYNANPSSMADSFEAFQQAFPHEPKCYVLGCMNELGTQSAQLHRQVGKSLILSKNDRVLIIGEEADDLAAGLLEAGNPADQVMIPSSRQEIREMLMDFKGAVLLKGSRSHHLELVLPDQWNEELSMRRKAC